MNGAGRAAPPDIRGGLRTGPRRNPDEPRPGGPRWHGPRRRRHHVAHRRRRPRAPRGRRGPSSRSRAPASRARRCCWSTPWRASRRGLPVPESPRGPRSGASRRRAAPAGARSADRRHSRYQVDGSPSRLLHEAAGARRRRGRRGRLAPGRRRARADRRRRGRAAARHALPGRDRAARIRVDHALSRIGVAFDGGPESDHALAVAIAIAGRTGRLGARVHGRGAALGADLPRRARWSRPPTNAAARRPPRRRLTVRSWRSQRDIGAPPSRARTAEQTLAGVSELDLIVCGSRGYGALHAVAGGSVARALAHRAACPLIVPRSRVARSRAGARRAVDRRPRSARQRPRRAERRARDTGRGAGPPPSGRATRGAPRRPPRLRGSGPPLEEQRGAAREQEACSCGRYGCTGTEAPPTPRRCPPRRRQPAGRSGHRA